MGMFRFYLIYSENQEQKVELKDLKSLQYHHKSSTCKSGTIQSMVAKNVGILKGAKYSALRQ